jgi:hypothetical protein
VVVLLGRGGVKTQKVPTVICRSGGDPVPASSVKAASNLGQSRSSLSEIKGVVR